MAIAAETQPRTADPRRAVIINLAINLVAPLGLFYGLRAAGVDQWLALMLGAIPPTAHAIHGVVVRRKIDALALFTLSILGLSVATSFVTGSPRFLLARDGWMTAVAGVWILATLWRTPFLQQFLMSMTTGETRERFTLSWRDSPTYRHVLRMATVMWGVGLLGDSVVRVVLAYALPVDQVPLINTLQYLVVYFALEIATRLYLRRKSVAAKVLAESGQVMMKGRKK
ncbi:VC0807 family protein [Kutzneria chonburiensis]|uniref:VC0807 family protein n=1 Tax=Kutzneria chonburiensis TaxID=1483604 RepID=A0ABV6MJN6_9PSEU|nr:VC0807 family protein [Kutzneria chonburiensis]